MILVQPLAASAASIQTLWTARRKWVAGHVWVGAVVGILVIAVVLVISPATVVLLVAEVEAVLLWLVIVVVVVQVVAAAVLLPLDSPPFLVLAGRYRCSSANDTCWYSTSCSTASMHIRSTPKPLPTPV